MPRTCTICRHEQRAEIDRALVSGESYRGIAPHFAVSEDAAERHGKAHLPARIAKAAEAKQVARADSLLDQLVTLNTETREILREARQDGRKGRGVALLAIARVEKQIELQARLLGELRDQAAVTVNVLATPEWTAVQTKIVRVLGPYPEARAAVADALAGRVTREVVVTHGRP